MSRIKWLLPLLFFFLCASPSKAFTRVQNCNAGALLNSCTLTMSANHGVVVFQNCYSSCGTIGAYTPTDSYGTVYTEVVGTTVGCAGRSFGPSQDFLKIWWGNTGIHSGSNTISGGTGRFIWVTEYDGSIAPDGSSCQTGPSAGAAGSGNLTTISNGDLLVTFGEDCTFTAGTNVTFYSASAPGFPPFSQYVMGDATLGAAGTYQSTGTTTSCGGTDLWIWAAAAFTVTSSGNAWSRSKIL